MFRHFRVRDFDRSLVDRTATAYTSTSESSFYFQFISIIPVLTHYVSYMLLFSVCTISYRNISDHNTLKTTQSETHPIHAGET